jgi:uncharacterized protein YecT (DUF1311 family)
MLTVKQIFSFFLFCLLANSLSAQEELSYISDDKIKKIKAAVEKEIPALKQKLQATDQYSPDGVEFYLDTFRIEQTCSRAIDFDPSTRGMNFAAYETQQAYDKLMNKYYNKLIKKLSTEDKKEFISYQKTWLAFRDSEFKAFGMLAKEEYSGGGTMQSNIESGRQLEVVRSRAVQIFNYYDGITN